MSAAAGIALGILGGFWGWLLGRREAAHLGRGLGEYGAVAGALAGVVVGLLVWSCFHHGEIVVGVVILVVLLAGTALVVREW